MVEPPSGSPCISSDLSVALFRATVGLNCSIKVFGYQILPLIDFPKLSASGWAELKVMHLSTSKTNKGFNKGGSEPFFWLKTCLQQDLGILNGLCVMTKSYVISPSRNLQYCVYSVKPYITSHSLVCMNVSQLPTKITAEHHHRGSISLQQST